jgi:hypothetical protein
MHFGGPGVPYEYSGWSKDSCSNINERPSDATNAESVLLEEDDILDMLESGRCGAQ